MKALFIASLSLIAALIVTAQILKAPLKAGDKAPEFALTNGDGKLVTLSEYIARAPVVIIFYRGFW